MSAISPLPTQIPAASRLRRRWLSFSLRVLFVLITLVCLALGWLVNRCECQRLSVAAIRAAGGDVRYEPIYLHSCCGGYDTQPFTWRRWMDRRGFPIDYYSEVERVQIFIANTSPKLQHLAAVRGCSRLTIAGSVRDDDLAVLRHLPNLHELILNDTNISDAAMPHIARCRNLTWLSVDRTNITDAGLAYIAQCRNLTCLNFNYTSVTDQGLKHFRELPLRTLRLHGTSPTT
jgi:hypothetical protein